MALGSHLILLILLSGYWVIPIPLALTLSVLYPDNLRVAVIVLIYLTGLILMMGSDYQKYHALKKRKGSIEVI